MPCGPGLLKAGAKKGDSAVLVSGLEINEVMKNVPEGKLIALGRLCEIIAEKQKTDYCCALTSGIYITVATNAAEEMGKDVPWWRTLKNGGDPNKKFLGGLRGKKNCLRRRGKQ